MTPEDQRAATEWNGAERRAAADCDAGKQALRYLNGEGPKQPGVFSRLDRIERLLGLGVLVISGPLWWVAWMIHEWIKKQGAA